MTDGTWTYYYSLPGGELAGEVATSDAALVSCPYGFIAPSCTAVVAPACASDAGAEADAAEESDAGESTDAGDVPDTSSGAASDASDSSSPSGASDGASPADGD